jgi:sugar phosphate isomerase/epimerase
MSFEIGMTGKKKFLAALHDTGVRVSTLITNIEMSDSSSGNQVKIRKKLIKVLEQARKINAGMLMIIPFFMPGKHKKLRDKRNAVTLAYIENFNMAVKLGNEYGVKICLEDTPAASLPLSSTRECRDVLENVPGLGLVFDTANTYAGGSDPLDFYETLKEYIVHAHIKDIVCADKGVEDGPDGRRVNACVWGQGIVPLKEILSRIEKDGLDVCLSIEYTRPEKRDYAGHFEHIKAFVDFIDQRVDSTG